MSVAPGSMSIILPIVERVTRLPGQALVLVAAGLDAAVLAVGWLAGRSGDSVGAWIPFIFGVLAAISILVFGVLRYRLEKRVEKTAARFGGLVRDPAAQSRKPNDDGATSRDVVVVS
ncbi:MAG: hypothetical protein ACTHWM_09855 [Yaniella sp.]|uniref:hypothetical protein n=1 Tax=Yaniella sp. TaxID=2773929 RepID=UPI003F9608F1